MNLIESALDLRVFLEEIRQRGDLIDVSEEVDADLEIAAISRRVYEKRLPAPLFNNIKGALPDSRVLSAPAGMLADKDKEYARLALHFGLPEDARPKAIVKLILAAMQRTPLEPRIIDSAPCKENKWLGDEVDLTVSVK